jgi:type IV secretory pathway VirB2 component (pilin)
MKISKKIVLRILPVVIVLVVMLVTNGAIQGTGNDGFGAFNPDMSVTAEKTDTIGAINRVWGIILTILQVAAVAAVVFAGVKYMFTSADQKADIKKSLGILALGAILVFGASTVIQFLTGAFKEIAGQ